MPSERETLPLLGSMAMVTITVLPAGTACEKVELAKVVLLVVFPAVAMVTGGAMLSEARIASQMPVRADRRFRGRQKAKRPVEVWKRPH